MGMSGLHILGTFTGCDPGALALDGTTLTRRIRDIVVGCGLRPVAESFHDFPGGGVTAVVCLAESHAAVHTWPGEGLVTCDVFTCNHTKDTTNACRQAFAGIAALCGATDVRSQEIRR
jgi:S-adenosylmethionine decarboxylase